MTGGVVAVIAVAGWLLVAHAVVNAVLLRRPPVAGDVTEKVSILVPARDEESRIAGCVAALLGQQHLDDAEILVLDDRSGDRTAEIVQSLFGTSTSAHARRLLPGGEPPPGWLGKPHACATLAAAAAGQVLVFVDADVVLARDAVARSVRLLRASGLDLVSPYPRQLTGSLLEALVQPLLLWSLLTLLPLRLAERSRRRSLSAANGQLVVVDTAAYLRAGGHQAVRDQVMEDTALVHAVKRAGGHGGICDGTAIASCRMYDDARSLVSGHTKWLWSAFPSRPAALGTSALLLLVFVMPWPLAISTPWAWVAIAPGPVSRLVVAVRTRSRPLPDALAHPLSILLLASLVLASLRGARSGSLSWKGRPVQ